MAGRSPEFLGRGWSFPPGFLRESATTDMVSDVDDIRQSLSILLSTSPGERIMVPKFGCALWPMVFENWSITLKTKLQDVVRRAILHWEPRITVDRVVAEADRNEPGLIRIEVTYTIRVTNARSNFVYPFYLHEATIAPPAP
jgi:phage baseplate assembly protein W